MNPAPVTGQRTRKNRSTADCRLFAGPLLLLLAGLLSGCSDGFPERYPVTGSVRFRDGEPVRTGTIELCIPGSRWSASGKIERDGTFRLSTVKEGDGAITGTHKILIRQLIVVYLPAEGGHDHGKLVSPRYGDYATTDLEVGIEPRRNEILVEVDE